MIISEDHWGKGIATQAVKMICKEAFTAFDIVRIYAEPFDFNAASKSVLKKAGFTYEGTIETLPSFSSRLYSAACSFA